MLYMYATGNDFVNAYFLSNLLKQTNKLMVSNQKIMQSIAYMKLSMMSLSVPAHCLKLYGRIINFKYFLRVSELHSIVLSGLNIAVGIT